MSILERFRRFLSAHSAYLQVDCTTRPQSEIHLPRLLIDFTQNSSEGIEGIEQVIQLVVAFEYSQGVDTDQ